MSLGASDIRLTLTRTAPRSRNRFSLSRSSGAPPIVTGREAGSRPPSCAILAFRDRAPRIEWINGGDHVVVEADQILSGIGLISNAGARFAAPEPISAQGRFEDVHRGGYDPAQHLTDMALDGVAGEVLYPSQGLFYFKVADTPLMSAIFRAYNDWLPGGCRTH